jgi:hypothetical protein
MFLRKITQETAYPRPPEEAFEDVREALLRLGKLKSADEASRTLRGSMSGGGWVTLEVTISPAEGGSLLSLIARCDDVWGSGARRGIAALLKDLSEHQGGSAAPIQARSIAKAASLEDALTLGEKLSVGLFLLLASMGSLDVAWKRGLFPLSLEWLLLLSAASGAFAGLMLGKPRYWAIGLVSGAVTGLSAVGFSVFAFSQMTSTYKLVALVTTLLGCLPGIALFLGLRWLQDRLFPPRRRPRAQQPGPAGDQG